jgi:hypothetical protein
MKIGILCEGGLQSEDQQVLRALAQRIVPSAQIEIHPQGSKPELIVNCGSATQALLASGCCRALIVWDVQPRWGRPDGAQQDEQDIRQELARHGLANHPCVFLVPIKAELEAWLLADGSALSQVLSRSAHPVQVGNTRNVESQGNPKKQLVKIFQQRGKLYVPAIHASQIVASLGSGSNFGALSKVPSFRRFETALTVAC